ncbi:universal stress protein [Arthrobacter sp. STN4]|uniref:universal stress protein n=1 Tax=Arthrobacter sp. STN4 TaxID=2923276 RepID=UPI00211A0AEC|nr:universal stress protein [Arthrobacter sp. STN4]MCQ9165535.1 universal stress protein [Arthrobacter sp. STN4]
MNTDTGMGRIVVGVDGSAASVEALTAAARIAGATGARVDAVACWSVPTALSVAYALGTVKLEDGARKVLDETMRQAFGERLPENVSALLVKGHPRQVLLDASEGAEMLVVGRRGRGGFPGPLLGSVSQACIAHARCPVLVISQEAPPDGAAPGDSRGPR